MNNPIPEIEPQWLLTCTTPSPEHFTWEEGKVGIPRQLIHQIPKYDFSLPTGSYLGKIFIRLDSLVWLDRHDFVPATLTYKHLKYEEIREYAPNPHLEPCPLCHEECYCGFDAKPHGDLVKFYIECAACGLSYGNQYKIGLERAIEYSREVIHEFNHRKPRRD